MTGCYVIRLAIIRRWYNGAECLEHTYVGAFIKCAQTAARLKESNETRCDLLKSFGTSGQNPACMIDLVALNLWKLEVSPIPKNLVRARMDGVSSVSFGNCLSGVASTMVVNEA